MKLLLDVHHSHVVASTLTAAGHDVVAAALDATLATLEDEELLRTATRAGRALVTENAADLQRIVSAWATANEHHAGVVFTSARRFRRSERAYPENLITALGTLLRDPPEERQDWVCWLR